jgi:hypothetical protein
MPDLKMINAHDPQVVRRVTDLLQEGRLTYVPIRNALGDVVTRLEWFRDNGVTCFPISKFDFDQHGDKHGDYILNHALGRLTEGGSPRRTKSTIINSNHHQHTIVCKYKKMYASTNNFVNDSRYDCMQVCH